jgi:hypothetical protein
MPDLGNVMGSLHRERLTLRFEGVPHPLPEWADWLIWLGAWMRTQAVLEGRRVAVVVLPTRRLAAAFVGLGAMLAASRLHDDTLDWEALQTLRAGASVHWRDARGPRAVSYAGTVDGVREVDGSHFLAIAVQAPAKSRGTTFLLPRTTALGYGVTQGAVTHRGEEALAHLATLLKAVVDDSSAAWTRSPMADSTLVTERASFLADLEGLMLEAQGTPATALYDALAIADPESRKHGKLRLIPLRDHGNDDVQRGVTILDGPRAASRLGQCRARSVVVLMDQASFDEEVTNELNRFLAHSVDGGIHAGEGTSKVVAPPLSIDVFAFALPEGRDQFEGVA